MVAGCERAVWWSGCSGVDWPSATTHSCGFNSSPPVLLPHLSPCAPFISLAGNRPCGVLRNGVFYPTLVSWLPQQIRWHLGSATLRQEADISYRWEDNSLIHAQACLYIRVSNLTFHQKSLNHTQLPSKWKGPDKFGMKSKLSVQLIFPSPPSYFAFLKRKASDVLMRSNKCQNENYLQPL